MQNPPGSTKPILALGLVLLIALATVLAHCRRAPAAISADLIAKARLRTVEIFRPGDSNPIGSGLLLNRNGLVLTCDHILRSSRNGPRHTSRQVILSQAGHGGPASLLHSDPGIDLAILHWRLPAERALAVADLKDLLEFEAGWVPRDELAPGDPALLVGSPYGLADSVLIGSIAHTARLNTDLEPADIPLIQTSGLSYPGNSGAAVFVADGRVAGINRATFGFSPGTGIGLTIPAGYARAFLLSFVESRASGD